jgi:hypothetical protein
MKEKTDISRPDPIIDNCEIKYLPQPQKKARRVYALA